MSPFHGDFAVLVIVWIGAFIEGHDDVRTEVLLNSNGTFGCEAMRRAVNVTLEGHAVIVNLTSLCQRKNLIAARVGQHGTRPLHKAMQSAQLSDQVVAGTQIKMIGITQHERGVDVFEMFGRQRLDRGLRADWREDRRDEIAVPGVENPGAGAVVLGCDFEFKH